MSLTVSCSECGHEYEADSAQAGKQVSCPSCDASIRVPRLNSRNRQGQHSSESLRDRVEGQGISTHTILLIGSSILLLGVIAMIAVRFRQLDRADPSIEGSDPASQTGNIVAAVASDDPESGEQVVASSPLSNASPATGSSETGPGKTVTAENSGGGPSTSDGAVIDSVDSDRGRQLMASMIDVAVRIESLAQDSRGVVASAVDTGVRAELEKCKLPYRAGSIEPVMFVRLDVRQQSGKQQLWMSAELRAKDGAKVLKVWERSGSVAPISDQALNSGILPPNLDRDITTFFRSLRGDFVEARRQFPS